MCYYYEQKVVAKSSPSCSQVICPLMKISHIVFDNTYWVSFRHKKW